MVNIDQVPKLLQFVDNAHITPSEYAMVEVGSWSAEQKSPKMANHVAPLHYKCMQMPPAIELMHMVNLPLMHYNQASFLPT